MNKYFMFDRRHEMCIFFSGDEIKIEINLFFVIIVLFSEIEPINKIETISAWKCLIIYRFFRLCVLFVV